MKKRILVFLSSLGIAALLTSCNAGSSPQAFAEKFMTAEHNAWETGNLDVLETLESPDVIYHLPGIDLTGWDAHRDYILQARPNVQDLKQEWKYLSGGGDTFALSYDATATEIATETTPARKASSSYVFAFRMKDGRIAEVWANGTTTYSPAFPK